DPEVSRDRLDGALDEDTHALLMADSETAQLFGDAIRQGIEVAVGDLVAPQDNRCLSPVGPGDTRKQVDDGLIGLGGRHWGESGTALVFLQRFPTRRAGFELAGRHAIMIERTPDRLGLPFGRCASSRTRSRSRSADSPSASTDEPALTSGRKP